MKKNGTTVRVLLLLAAAIILAFAMEWGQIATQPKRYEEEPLVIQEAGGLDFEKCELTDAEVKSGSLSLKGEGAMIVYDFGAETELPFLRLESKKHQKGDVQIRIELARDGADFQESDTVIMTAEAGGNSWETSLPEGLWRRIRLTADGKMSLRSIVYSDGVYEQVVIREGLHIRRVLILIPVIFLVLLFLHGVHAGKRMLGMIRLGWNNLTASPRITLIHLGIFLFSGCAGYFLAQWAFTGSFGETLNLPQQTFCLAVATVIACLATFRKTLGRKPEVLFVVLCLCAGSLMVFWYSPTSLVSWDDEFHFSQALTYSYLGEQRLTAQEYDVIMQEVDAESGFELGETRDAWMARMEQRYAEGAVEVREYPMQLSCIYELFPGLGLYLGRLMGLGYYGTYCLGKLFNLLTYTLCGYFAVRKLKSGKMILAVFLLIPTTVFLASVYSYDPGLTGFTALGLAWCFGEWQEPDKKLTWGSAGIMIGSMLFGLFTKAVYFPLLLLPVLLPKTKFRQEREAGGISRKAFWILAAAAMLILLSTFLLPMLGGTMEADARGGDGVDVYGQLRHILSNPFGYLGLLFGFIRDFMAPRNANGLFNLFGFMGYGMHSSLFLGLLLAVAFTDKHAADRKLESSWVVRSFSLAVMLGLVCVVCTTMYMAYTPVGGTSFGGVQHRYLIPMHFPTLMLLGSGWIGGLLWDSRYRWNRSKRAMEIRQQVYNALVFLLALWVLFSGVWNTCISKFTV